MLVPLATAISIQEALYSHNTLALQAHLGTLLMQSVSSCTTVGEKFFHGLVLGLCATLSNRYSLLSDYDSVKGRYAIYLCPTETTLPGILIELKATRNCSDEELKRLSDKVLEQMNGRKFETDLLAQGVKSIFKYGVAFNGKSVKMSTSKR